VAILILRLPSISVLDLVGKDAAAILHNLTTNDIKSLVVDGIGVETFITNVKGKCIGHVLVFRNEEGYRLIGAAGQSETIVQQMDRYTIREDATPQVLDDQFDVYLVVNGNRRAALSYQQLDAGDIKLYAYGVPWFGSDEARGGVLILTAKANHLPWDTLADALLHAGILQTSDALAALDETVVNAHFHALRIAAAYPWFGTDFDDSHLPQEVNREPETISFKKGCYLGQETIARLDALGQVQKKLVQWSIENLPEGCLPEVDTKLFADSEKPVGRLTSIAQERLPGQENGCTLALGFARRSHFDLGATATGMVAEHPFVAKVERT
jgi:folate-binding protein YgfZ